MHWPFGRGRTGAWEPRRIEVEGYGRRTRKGQEVRVLTGWEVGEIGENYTTVPNILQRDQVKKKGVGNAKHRRQEVWTSPFPLLCLRKITIYTVVFIGRPA